MELNIIMKALHLEYVKNIQINYVITNFIGAFDEIILERF